MNLNDWKDNINIKYEVAREGLKRIRKEDIYRSTQYLIDYCAMRENHDFVRQLSEFLEDHYGISDYHIMLQDLHVERIKWLKSYTNSNYVKDNEYYRNISFKCIHEDYAGYDVQILLKPYNSII